MWEVSPTTVHDRKSALVSALLEEFKFLHIKKFLGGQRLRCDQDTKHVLQYWLKGLATNFFEEGIQKLVPRQQKYFNLHGD